MRLTRKDAAATLSVVVAGALYALWLAGIVMPDVSTRVFAAIILGLGFAGCVSDGAEMKFIYGTDSRTRPPMAYVVTVTLVGITALVAAVIAIAGGSEAMLAVLVVTMVILWLMSTIRHATAYTRTEPKGGIEPLAKAA